MVFNFGTVDVLAQIILYCEVYRMFSSIPGLCLLDADSSLLQ